MPKTRLPFLILAVLFCTGVLACTNREAAESQSARELTSYIVREEPVRLSRDESVSWPKFLIAFGSEREYLWGTGGRLYRGAFEGDSFRLRPAQSSLPSLFTSALLFAATAPDSETLAILDVGNRVNVIRLGSKKTWAFEIGLPGRPAGLAVVKDTVYVSVKSEAPGIFAVLAFDLSGKEIGRWGEMPLDGVLQTVSQGGGMTSCPDGSIYYTYLNSPEIYRIHGSEIEIFGRADDGFKALGRRAIRKALVKSREEQSARPLVELGLSGSRVVSLACSPSSLLLRQVATPGAGSHVEVWDSQTQELLGHVDIGSRVLFAAEDQELVLASDAEETGLRVQELRFDRESTKSET